MNTLGLFGMNLLTIANLISTDSIVFGIQHNYIGTGFVLIGALISSKKYYLKLCEKYKEEQHGSIKGWCVFTYICASIVAYCYSFND